MKNDQEKIIYPSMQLPTMFEMKLKGDQQLCYLVLNGINLNLIQIANATDHILISTQTKLKVAYLDSLFSLDHFSYIICYIWS